MHLACTGTIKTRAHAENTCAPTASACACAMCLANVKQNFLKVSGGSRGGLRGLEHPPRSKFRLQRELTGVINSFRSAKTHCGEPTRSYNARALNYDHTYYVYEHERCKGTRCATRMRKIRGVVPTIVCELPPNAFPRTAPEGPLKFAL